MHPTPCQRNELRFCKAFFEVRDLHATRRKLRENGMLAVAQADPNSKREVALYWWEAEIGGPQGAEAVFLVRLFPARLILEGPSATAIGHGWRLLAEILDGAAVARVASGDELRRFLPKPASTSADQPQTLDKEAESKVLAEFYAGFCRRCAIPPSKGWRISRRGRPSVNLN